MKLTRFPFIALTLSAMAATSQAQVSSHTYRTVDAYGNAVKTTVQTPLADARSVAGLIAQQGLLGANTTTSTSITYGTYGNINSGYCPPAVVYNNVPTYPYGYGYGYAYPYQQGVVNNNYYYPALPTTGPLAPANNDWSRPAWVTNIPIGNQYSSPAYPYGYPEYPSTYYGSGQGYSTIAPLPNGGYTYGVGVQVGGGRGSTTTTTTTTTTRGAGTRSYRQAPSIITNPPPLLAPGVKPNLILPR